jgi:hypothetical protein
MRAARPRVQLRGAACILTIVGALAVCAPADAKGKPDAPPAELLVSVAIGPVTTLRNLQAYAEMIQPGSGAALSDQVVRRGLAEVVGATSLDGLDPASWMYLLVAGTSGPPAVALLGKVADAKALAAAAGADRLATRGGWAVIGDRPVLDHIGAYALSTIAAQPTPRAPNATVYMPQVLARGRPQIEAFRAQMAATSAQLGPGPMGKFMASYIDGLESMASDTERLIVTLDATPDLASLDLALMPRPSSRLAAFIGLQRPSDFGLFARLPATTPTVLFGGHLELGPYHDGLLAAMATLYIPEASRDLLAAMEMIRKVMTGEIAMAMQIGRGTGLAFTQLYGITNAAAADKALAGILALFKVGRTIQLANISTTIQANPGTATHDGVVLRSYDTTQDLSKAPADQRKAMAAIMPDGVQHVQMATFDGLTMIVAAPDSLAEAERSIDAARGKAGHFVASADVDRLLAAVRARKDSTAMMIDLGGVLAMLTGGSAQSQPAMISFGAADRSAHLRIALPAATVRALSAASAARP